jgi:hypothetical protein
VDIPRPRDLRIKREARFVELVTQVWDLLHGPESRAEQDPQIHVG